VTKNKNSMLFTEDLSTIRGSPSDRHPTLLDGPSQHSDVAVPQRQRHGRGTRLLCFACAPLLRHSVGGVSRQWFVATGPYAPALRPATQEPLVPPKKKNGV
jgi:hypothetical protein